MRAMADATPAAEAPAIKKGSLVRVNRQAYGNSLKPRPATPQHPITSLKAPLKCC